MKRRHFIQYGLLSGTSFAASMAYRQPSSAFSSSESEKKHYKWIILYWMPYDNNLSRFAAPILEMLAKAVQSDNILVVVQSDVWKARNMSRHAIAKGKIEIQQLETANSASEEVFAEYLKWASSQFVADKWAIAFLGHGGRLDEICPDANPRYSDKSETQWMNIQKVSEVILNFNRTIGQKLDLLFFQNCNKGTIEIHYTFREAAEYTLSSQKLLGAPNYYYESALQFLGLHPEINGGQLAEKIMASERFNMYNSYTVTANQFFQALPTKFNPLIDEIISSKINFNKAEDLKIYNYEGENFVDAVLLVESLAKQAVSAQKPCAELVSFLKNSLIYKYQHNPIKPKSNLSGLGLLWPTSKLELEKYRYLPVFSDIKLVELYQAILFDG